MAIRKIRTYGDPCLERESDAVLCVDDELRRLMADLVETMHDANGVGLAAPQVGVNLNALVIEIEQVLFSMINPVIVRTEGKEKGPEGCLSFPEISADVVRAAKVVVRFRNLEWQEMELTAEGLLARAVQHEIDHLTGTLFVQRMGAATRLTLRKKLKTMKAETLEELAVETAA